MNKALFSSLYSFVILLLLVSVNGADLTCTYSTTACSDPTEEVFYAHDVLSSNIGFQDPNPFPLSYNHNLCCTASAGTLTFTNEPAGTCVSGEVLGASDTINARVSVDPILASYPHSICGSYDLGVLDVRWEDSLSPSGYDYPGNGYECMFEANRRGDNSHVSRCGAGIYRYVVWGILFDSGAGLNCNLDCTSKIDDRVYTQCGTVLPSQCSDTHVNCNGALKGSWVQFNTTHEIQCSAPWNVYRQVVFSAEGIEVTSVGNECDNLIRKDFTVILDKERVTMGVYICS